MSFSEKNEIKIEKPKIEKLSNVAILRTFWFYNELKIVKTAKAFKKYAKSCNFEIIKDKDGNMNDPLAQIKVGKRVIKDLFRDLLIEIKGFKYQITINVLPSKQKERGKR